MKIKPLNLLIQLSGAVIFGFLGAVAGLLIMVTYGGRHGCWAFIDTLFNLRGYESCGMLGGWLGLFIGVTIGVFLVHKIFIKKSQAFSYYKGIFIPFSILALLLIFTAIYFKSAHTAQEQMDHLEAEINEKMIHSNVFDLNVPIQISNLTQSTEELEVLFTQGQYEVTVRLMTGASAEKWASDLKSHPNSENINSISYAYPNEWSPHVALMTEFGYEKPSEFSGAEAFEKNRFMAIEGLKILENDPRLKEEFRPKVKELRSSLMVDHMNEPVSAQAPKMSKIQEGFVPIHN